MPVGTAADSSSLAAVITAYLNGTSSPEPFQTAAPQTHRVSHGAPITLPKNPKKSQKFPCKRHTHAPRIPPLPSHCPAYPAVNLPLSQTTQRHRKPHGVSHGLPRRSPSGRRRAHPSSLHRSYKSYKSYASATPTHPAYPRCHHIARHTPAVNFRPSHSRQRHRKPTGYHMTPPSSLHRSYKSYKSYASVTPTHPAYRRCHQKSPAYPCGKSTPGYAPRIPPLPSNRQAYPTGTFAPEPNQTAALQTHGVSHGAPITLPKIPKKSPKFPCKRPPTQHAYRRCHQKSLAYLNGTSSPEPFQTAAPQTHGVSHDLPRRSPSGRRRAHPSCQTGQTGQTGQTQAPRPRTPHTAVAITLPGIPQRHIFARAIPDSGTANPRGIQRHTITR